jgi:excisionase family DNA binding protein
MQEDLYYTVEEVARILRKHENTIRRWCNDGTLKGARKFGNDWYIPRATIDPETPTPREEKPKRK